MIEERSVVLIWKPAQMLLSDEGAVLVMWPDGNVETTDAANVVARYNGPDSYRWARIPKREAVWGKA